MGDKTWKVAERRVAVIFGVRRKIGSGCDVTREGGDIDHEFCHVEVKMRKNQAVLRWWEEVEPAAMKEGKLPVLVIFEKRNAVPFLVCPLGADYLLRLGRILHDVRSVDAHVEVEQEDDGEVC
jgi:hypothetical protein